MIIDFHTHIGRDNSGEKDEGLDFETLKKSMDKWGVDKSVVFCFNGEDKKLISDSIKILKKSKEEDWIIPFLRFNPKTILKNELSALLDKGFKGVKLHPRGQNFEIANEKYFWIYQLLEEKKIPVLFHSSVKNNNSHPSNILRIVEKFPNLIIIIAHFFGNDFSIMKTVNKYPNIYTDLSVNSGTLKRKQAFEEYNVKNMLFASDAPYDSQGVALLKIKEAGLSEEAQELILSKNAKKILNL